MARRSTQIPFWLIVMMMVLVLIGSIAYRVTVDNPRQNLYVSLGRNDGRTVVSAHSQASPA